MLKVNEVELMVLEAIKRSKSGMTGYDIAKGLKIQKKTHQYIYKLLRKLSSSGHAEKPLLNVTDVPQTGKPDKKVYTLAKDAEYVPDVDNISTIVLRAYCAGSVLNEKEASLKHEILEMRDMLGKNLDTQEAQLVLSKIITLELERRLLVENLAMLHESVANI